MSNNFRASLATILIKWINGTLISSILSLYAINTTGSYFATFDRAWSIYKFDYRLLYILKRRMRNN